jgi:YebC/PmpR family DNA-binding regulatory protein
MKFQSVLSLLLLSNTHAFGVTNLNNNAVSTSTTSPSRLSPLFMGRAAAVRAATKSKTDAKKAKTNAVYGKKIIMAVKQGGPDPDSNRALGELIKSAKANSVPVDNINRAIKKASEASTANFSESTFEAYGFGGASMVINVLTDNDNRANADVRVAVQKNGGKMAEQGSVLFMYDRKGKLEVPPGITVDEENLMEAAIESDVDDYELVEPTDEEEPTIVYVETKDTNNMFEALKGMDAVKDSEVKMELIYLTKAPVEVEDEDFESNMKILDALEELDDVDSVEHNMSN